MKRFLMRTKNSYMIAVSLVLLGTSWVTFGFQEALSNNLAVALDEQSVSLLKMALVRCEYYNKKIEATELVNQLAQDWCQDKSRIKTMLITSAISAVAAGVYNDTEISQAVPWISYTLLGIATVLSEHAQKELAIPEERFFELAQLLRESPMVIIYQESLSPHACQLLELAAQYAQNKKIFNGIVIDEKLLKKLAAHHG
jgi:dsRNA-specific ribonuclease